MAFLKKWLHLVLYNVGAISIFITLLVFIFNKPELMLMAQARMIVFMILYNAVVAAVPKPPQIKPIIFIGICTLTIFILLSVLPYVFVMPAKPNDLFIILRLSAMIAAGVFIFGMAILLIYKSQLKKINARLADYRGESTTENAHKQMTQHTINIGTDEEPAELIFQKTDDGMIMISLKAGSVDKVIHINSEDANFVLNGQFELIDIAAPVRITAGNAEINKLNIRSGNVHFTISSNAKAETVNVEENVEDTSVFVSGKVGTINLSSSITIENTGIITQAMINANDVIFDGKTPIASEIGSSVTRPPVNSGRN
jgi:hypothetical protein